MVGATRASRSCLQRQISLGFEGLAVGLNEG